MNAETTNALPASMDSARTRVAFYGLRHDHAWWVIPQLLELTTAELVAVAGERPDLIARAQQMPGVDAEAYLDLESMLDQHHPDALVALAPNSEHLAIAEACARRAIHLYTHKPMVTTHRDAITFQSTVQNAGIVCVVNTYPLFRPVVRRFFDRIAEVGKLRKFVAMAGIPGPRRMEQLSRDYTDWMCDPLQHGGGALIDAGTYGLLCATWMLGRPCSVTASLSFSEWSDSHGAEDDSWVLLEFADATAIVHGSWCMPYVLGLELIAAGEHGQLRVWNDEVWFRSGRSEGSPSHAAGLSEAPPEPRSPWRNGVEHFIHCIRYHKPVHFPLQPDIHVTVHEVVDAAYASASSGARVDLL